MATPAQLLANQTNAHLSSGPRTEAGKQTSAQNGATHGLGLSDPALLRAEPAAYAQLVAEFTARYRPVDSLAEHHVTELALSIMRMRRHTRREAEILETATDLLAAMAELQPLDRYRRSAERSLARALKELRQEDTTSDAISLGIMRASTGPALNRVLDLAYPATSTTTKQQTEPSPAKLAVAVPTNKQTEPNPVTTYVRPTPKVGRNEPCPCQSGRKYKQCCLGKAA